MSSRALLCVAVTISLLAGCGLRGDARGGTSLAREIARLPALDETELEPLVDADIGAVVGAYQTLYPGLEDAEQNHAAGKRLADLQLERAGLAMADIKNPYDDAIVLYEGLLADGAGSDSRDSLLYQVAQAHDLAGRGDEALVYLDELIRDFPTSAYVREAHFRRAELNFSAGRYAAAATDYRVVAGAAEGRLALHSTYMLGWSEFKGSQLEAATEQFYRVVAETSAAHAAAAIDAPSSAHRGETELRTDSLRVLMLALEYQDGVATLAADISALDRPDWQHGVYAELAERYLTQRRYLDGAAVWRRFVDENPLDRRAPNAWVAMIDTLLDADFVTETRPQKAEFIARFGVRSEYWTRFDEAARASYAEPLAAYLDELSKVYHARAQASGKESDYLAAVDLYEQQLDSFPPDARTPDTLFLIGEIYAEVNRRESALAAFERLTSDYPEHEQVAEAAYAGLLLLDGLVDEAAVAADAAAWADRRLTARLAFAQRFAADPRAPTVQAAAADELFRREDYARSIELAHGLLTRGETLGVDLTRNSLLLIGHGSMELAQYAAAEQAYERLLTIGFDADVAERRLASVYKQGEIAEAEESLDAALGHYLRIGEIDPTAALAASAHFDAIVMLEGADRSADIARLLESFRVLYPQDERAAQVPLRLAQMYEADDDFARAALEYRNVAATSADTDAARQAQFVAAELYRKADDREASLAEYQAYVQRFPTPYDAHFEALQASDELLGELGRSRHGVWRSKVALHERVGRSATPRMSFLAAEAALGLAAIDREAFAAIRLQAPLKKSLRSKQRALKASVKAYEAVIDYAVAEFATAATYQIADLYVELSASIMASERPSGLNALELEQYEILLEEQAYPFEDQAIELHEINMRRAWNAPGGVAGDVWTAKSFADLKALMPGRYDKNERKVAYVENIH
ncbi:MAG: tetratricopeptide repeat protein [Pseudomonadota bacterium]